MVEIYGLFDPTSGALRYVGKAKNSIERFKRHLYESKTCCRPVNNWVRSLAMSGRLPKLDILEIVEDKDWQNAEKRLIALHRETAELLNLADGGDSIPMSAEQRKKNGKTLNSRLADKSPQMLAFIKAKQDYARVAFKFKKAGDIFGYWCMRMRMHNEALKRPDLCGGWLIYGR